MIHRAIDTIEAEILAAKDVLATLVREKEAARKSQQMKKLRADPAIMNRMRAGLERANDNPKTAIARLKNIRKANAMRRLPPMTKVQRKQYRKLRHAGVSRGETERAALA